jgi:hypothetical protein
MATPGILRVQDYQYQYQTLRGYWKWVTRFDMSQSSPRFEVRDIVSPYGILRDSIPIPGEVVTAMADSIQEIQTAFAPSILVSPSTILLTLDEGRGYGEPEDVQVTNDGIFGSLLSTSFTSSVGYVMVNPSSVGGLPFNQTGVFQVTADSTNLLAADSPFAATVTVQDPNATNNPVTIPVTIVVRPKALIVLSPTTLNFTVSKPLSGPFPPIPSQTFQIQNTGLAASVLDYMIQKLTNCSPWIVNIAPTTGQLPGGGIQNVTVTLAPPASLLPGVYTETLRVSGYSDNSYQDIQIVLTIT